MGNSTFTFLSKLQNILTFKNVESLKTSFIDRVMQKHENPEYSNFELGILEYYDAYQDKFITLNFENHLKEILSLEIQNCKYEIDSNLNQLNSIQKRKFLSYIQTTLKYIEKSESELLLKFHECKKPSEDIFEYLNVKYDISFSENKIYPNEESLFQVKSGIKLRHFSKLYDITSEYKIINDEFISEETFISVLRDKETSEEFIFNCKNGLAVMYLSVISSWFDNLKAKSIENSGRFYTKASKTLLTESNYNKSKKSISSKDSIILSKFTNEFNDILD